jgi:hypothetical protein
LKRRKKGRKINGTNLALESWVAIAGAVVSRLFLGINIDEVHKFCRVTLAVIDDLPTGESMIDGLPRALR